MSAATEAVALGRDEAARPTIRKWPATIAAMLGMMSTIMASTMMNVAISDIMGAYGIGQDRVHWLMTGFLSATTVFMLLNAWFVRNLGARNTFILACLVFVTASIFARTAPNFEAIVLARVVQGSCAGLIQPLGLGVIYSAFPPQERGKAMGIFGMGIMVGPAIGPLIGGVITDVLDWRFVFVGAVPVTLLAALLGARYLPGRDRAAPRAPMNWMSFIAVATAVATFLNGISQGQRLGWDSPTVLSLLLVSALAMIAFVEIESRTRNPLLNVRLFANPTFAVASLVGFVFGAGMFGSFYLLPIFVRTVQGFTGTKAGFLLLLSNGVSFAVFPIAGWIAQRYNPVWPVTAGMLLFGSSSLALTGIDADSAFSMLAGWSALGLVGLGLSIPALTVAALHVLDRELLPYGAGTLNFIRMLGGAMGVNSLAIILDQRATHHADLLTSTQSAQGGTTSELLTGVADMLARGGISAAERMPLALIHLGDIIKARANVLAFQDGYLALVIAFSVATLCALTLAWRPAGRNR